MVLSDGLRVILTV